jgi:hypothetical protein
MPIETAERPVATISPNGVVDVDASIESNNLAIRLVDLRGNAKKRPTFDVCKGLCHEGRSIWLVAWFLWVDKHDRALALFSDMPDAFTAARETAEQYAKDLVHGEPHSRKEQLAVHFAANLAWREQMARILFDDRISEHEREKEILTLMKAGPRAREEHH